MPQRSEVTRLLVAWRDGDAAALDQLVPLVEAELRRLAHRYVRRERPGHLLQTTALVNEAFIRLVSWRDVSWQNRSHFLAMSARMMRQILVDMSRRRPRGIDGGMIQFVDVTNAERTSADPLGDVVAIHEALDDLAERDPRKAQIVELRFFGGLTLDEIAEVLRRRADNGQSRVDESASLAAPRDDGDRLAWRARPVDDEAP